MPLNKETKPNHYFQTNQGSFVCWQLNDFKHCYVILIIQIDINLMFSLSQTDDFFLNIYLAHRLDPDRLYHSGSEWT